MTLRSDFTRTDRIAVRLTDTMIKEQLLPAYKQSLDNIRGEVGLLFEKHSKGGVLSMSEVSKYNRLLTLENDIAREMTSLTGKQVRVTSKTIKDVYQESYYRAAFALEKEVQVKLRFGQLPAKQVEASLVNPMDRIGWKDRTTEQAKLATRQIREEITRGIIQGKGYPDVARSVKERMDMAAGRAERIVRTEAHRAREEGKLASLEHAHNQGVEMEKVFSATLDDRTRDTHQAMDGQTVPMYDEDGEPGMFESPSGDRAEYPGGFADPSENIFCRCAARGQIKGYAPELRRSREEGIIPYKTYPEYAEAKGWPVKYKGAEPGVAGISSLERKIRDVERTIANEPLEHVKVFNNKGDVIYSKVGEKDRVGFMPEDVKIMNGQVMSHNHPGFWDISLSEPDIRFAKNFNLSEVRAVGPSRTYIAKPPPGGWGAIDKFEDTVAETTRAIKQEWTAKIQAGTLHTGDANRLFHHELWTQVSQKTNMRYTEIIRGD